MRRSRLCSGGCSCLLMNTVGEDDAMSPAATRTIPSAPNPGEIVRVRSRKYLVENVVGPPRPGDATLVSMACLDDDAQGQELEVLWEREVDPEILTGEAWQDLATRGFDPRGSSPPICTRFAGTALRLRTPVFSSRLSVPASRSMRTNSSRSAKPSSYPE